MTGISSIGVYLPRYSMQRKVIADQLAWIDPGLKSRSKGTRSVANWDEDAITMAVAAGRIITSDATSKIIFASTSAPFVDRSNAGLIAEALSLTKSCATLESSGSLRAATSALLSELQIDASNGTSLIASDRRAALPASTQELRYGDGAVAVQIGDDNLLAEFIGGTSEHTDFVDHYRSREQTTDYELEDRWVRDIVAGGLIPDAIRRAIKGAGIALTDIDHVVVPIPIHYGKTLLKELSLDASVLADNLFSEVGDIGAGHSLMMLANVLGSASSGEIICLVGVGQGVDVVLMRTTDLIKDSQQPFDAINHFRNNSLALNEYLKLPAFSRVMPLARGIRAEADKRTSMSAYYRHHAVINSMLGSRCTACDTPHFPAARVCVNCQAIDSMVSEPFADKTANVKTFTEDWQTATPSPPMTYGNIEFVGGGNAFLEMTDVASGEMQVGQELEMTFRVKDYDDLRGFRRYFWKPAPKTTPHLNKRHGEGE